MSDLREALEKLAEDWRYKSEDLTPWQEGGGPGPDEAALDGAADDLRKLLAAHPAEPAPDLTLHQSWHQAHPGYPCEYDTCPQGQTLELAEPAPGASRERVAEVLEEHGVLLFQPQPQCRCGHVYDTLHLGGVSWKEQALHRADAVLALINGGESRG